MAESEREREMQTEVEMKKKYREKTEEDILNSRERDGEKVIVKSGKEKEERNS